MLTDYEISLLLIVAAKLVRPLGPSDVQLRNDLLAAAGMRQRAGKINKPSDGGAV
jgi:hypothetical protein